MYVKFNYYEAKLNSNFKKITRYIGVLNVE